MITLKKKTRIKHIWFLSASKVYEQCIKIGFQNLTHTVFNSVNLMLLRDMHLSTFQNFKFS